MGNTKSVAILTYQELLREQLLREQDKEAVQPFFRWHSEEETCRVVARAVSRKMKEGWKLLAVDSGFFHSRYVFEVDASDVNGD
ncbi:MAG: hypothetical protein N2C14_28760 [Planctomycetales bacterium]